MRKQIVSLFLCLAAAGCSQGVKDTMQQSYQRVSEPAKTYVREKSLAYRLNGLRDKKDYAGTVKLYEENSRDIVDLESLRYVLEAYFMEGRYDRTIAMGDLIVSRYGERADGRIMMMTGFAYYKSGYAEAARKNLVKARELGEKDEMVAATLAELYMARGQFYQALDVAADLTGAVREYTQGMVHYREKNFSRAAEKFEKAGDFRDASRLRAFSLFSSGDIDGLLRLYGTGALRKYPDVCVLLANALLDRGKVGEARDMLEQQLKEHGDYPPVLRNLGIIYEMYLGDPDKARTFYLRYLREVNDEEVKGWLGRL